MMREKFFLFEKSMYASTNGAYTRNRSARQLEIPLTSMVMVGLLRQAFRFEADRLETPEIEKFVCEAAIKENMRP